jgi:hypothetical protein
MGGGAFARNTHVRYTASRNGGIFNATSTQPSWVVSAHQYSGKRIALLPSRIRPQAQLALVYAFLRPGFRVRQERFSLNTGPSIRPISGTPASAVTMYARARPSV